MKSHLSFDFWNTLAVFNPQFSAARVAVFAHHMGVDTETAKANYIAVKRLVDREAELIGKAYSSAYIFTALLRRVRADIDLTEVEFVQEKIQALALQYPPIILAGTKRVLNTAVEKGYSISITSNTNFVTGQTIRKILNSNGVPYLFGLFSDELPWAKPSPLIFNMVRSRIGPEPEITHFGDHKICDVKGARDAGCNGILVNYHTLEHDISSFTTTPIFA